MNPLLLGLGTEERKKMEKNSVLGHAHYTETSVENLWKVTIVIADHGYH